MNTLYIILNDYILFDGDMDFSHNFLLLQLSVFFSFYFHKICFLIFFVIALFSLFGDFLLLVNAWDKCKEDNK